MQTTLPLDALTDQPRLLIEAKLRPLAGTRFQPTGFPDLGAATYRLPDGTEMLLVESAQSMANRLETVCWDLVANDWTAPLRGLPYVAVFEKENQITNSVLEAHRLNSVYIKRSSQGRFHKLLRSEIDYQETRPINYPKFVKAIFKYDINSLVHGVFLESIAGRLRLPRALTAFIEAADAKVVTSGGVKNDILDPAKKMTLPAVDKDVSTEKDEERRGNVPFHREEFCGPITAYFNLDLALIRGFGLGADAERLLVALALYKIRRFLLTGLRLRTACDLEWDDEGGSGLTIKRPTGGGFTPPTLAELESALPALIQAAAPGFAQPARTVVTFEE